MPESLQIQQTCSSLLWKDRGEKLVARADPHVDTHFVQQRAPRAAPCFGVTLYIGFSINLHQARGFSVPSRSKQISQAACTNATLYAFQGAAAAITAWCSQW